MISVPDSFRAMPRWWTADPWWLDDLPLLVEIELERWGLLFDEEVWHGSNALVVAVRRGNEQLALRLAPPGEDVASELDALRFWNGRATVLVVDVHIATRAFLLERLDASRSLAVLPIDEARLHLGRVLRRQSIEGPCNAPSTGAVAENVVAQLEGVSSELGQLLDTAAVRAVVAAARRVQAPARNLAVNADLHYAQVLSGTREPWLAVDPILFRGDPEYALGPMLWNRLDELPDARALQRHIDELVASADLDADRARDWIAVRACDYLLWGLRRGLTEDPPRCRRLLAHVMTTT